MVPLHDHYAGRYVHNLPTIWTMDSGRHLRLQNYYVHCEEEKLLDYKPEHIPGT